MLRSWRGADSVIWLAVVAAAFTAAVLLLTPLRMGLGWDEAVYASQISHHLPLLWWGPQRARGMPLLVAPVTLLSTSVFALRVYLTLLAGGGLFLALLAWRGIRPAWVLSLAGVMFAGLGMAQSQASQVFPNIWIALGGLAAVGLFFRVWASERPPLRLLVPLAAAIAFCALMRPTDALFLAAPMLAVAAVAVARRSRIRPAVSLLLALLAGLSIGWGDWVFEAYRYFHGPAARFPATSKAVGGTAFDPLASLRILGGGSTTQVRGGWSHPKLLIWWAAFAILAVVGIWLTRRAGGWLLALVPAACAVSIYVLYSFPLRDNARYLLPAWALLTLPAAEAVAWVTTRPKGRLRWAAPAAALLFLAAEFGTQHVVLTNQSAALQAIARASVNAATDLRHLGVHGPCVITSVRRPFAPASGPAAYYAHCTYVRYLSADPVHRQGVVLIQGPGGVPWTYARDWPAYRLKRTGGVVAYIGPRIPRR